MILSFEEIDCKKLPMRKFFVTASCDIGPDDILRLCGKVPELHDIWDSDNAEFNGWHCCDISVTPEAATEHSWWIECKFKPPAIIIPDDESTFPPYNGPVGKQPDGSFVLTPRCLYYLSELMMRRHPQFALARYHEPYIDKLADVICEDTGTSFGEFT